MTGEADSCLLRIRSFFCGVAMLCVALAASAAPLSSLPNSRHGTDSITYDSISNLERVDLTVTLNESYSYITSQTRPDG